MGVGVFGAVVVVLDVVEVLEDVEGGRICVCWSVGEGYDTI